MTGRSSSAALSYRGDKAYRQKRSWLVSGLPHPHPGDSTDKFTYIAQTLDRVTGERLYRFVGQFELEGRGENTLGKKCEVYARVSDEWPIVR